MNGRAAKMLRRLAHLAMQDESSMMKMGLKEGEDPLQALKRRWYISTQTERAGIRRDYRQLEQIYGRHS